jgi:enoyl-CoA hydratase/carnithine racemase
VRAGGVEAEREGRVLVARLDRPLARNALDTALCKRLHQLLDEAAADSGISVLALGSTDPACFSAGMDTKEALEPGARTLEVLLAVQWALETFPKPVVGMLGGYVIGGGAELALSLDIRIGSPSSVFAFPGTGYGLAQGSWHLVDVVGKSRALELVLTGRRPLADECLELGLLHELHDDPDARGREVAAELAERSDAAMQEAKRMIVAAWSRPQRERFEEEQRVNERLMAAGEVGARMVRGGGRKA